MKSILSFILFLPLFVAGQYDVQLDELATGFTRPCGITHAGDERLFVTEQPGNIHIMYSNGTVLDTPFLDISDRVDADGGEKGLLGLAFPPNFCTTNVFYVNYTHTASQQLYTRVSRFTVDMNNPNLADPDSEEILMEFEQDFGNHNGGHLEFGPEGYLYIGTGDGGAGGDPNNRAQNIMSHLGKILRIDVSTDPYTIPEDNPYAFDDFGLDEIWSFGLRNPWKFSFDALTGDLYIGDVGQTNREEVNFQQAGAEGGQNYGWRCYEGTEEYDFSECDTGMNHDMPVFEYNWGGGRCAVTGGRVYRGASFDALYGKYLLSDYCSPEYWLLWEESGVWETYNSEGFEGFIVAFGEDVFGEMYAVKGNPGRVYRVLESSGDLLPHISVTTIENIVTLTSNLEGASYVWYLNSTPIEGATSNALIATETGFYDLEITSESGCVINPDGVQVGVLSSRDHEWIRSFEIFPNPASGIVWVDLTLSGNRDGDIQLNVFSIDGRRLKSFTGEGERIEMDLSGLSNGTYIVQLLHDNMILGSRKLVHQ